MASGVRANLAVVRTLNGEIARLEREIIEQVKLAAQYEPLLSIAGIGQILALAIMLRLERSSVLPRSAILLLCTLCGQPALVQRQKQGPGQRQERQRLPGLGVCRGGAFCRALQRAIKRFYQRKPAKTNRVVAIKAVAHKLARACYYILRDQVPFMVNKAFA